MDIKEVSPQEAIHLLGSGWSLIDVRTPAEFSAVHAEGAINIPLDQLDEGKLAELGVERKQLVVICQSGGRSRKGCEILSKIPDCEAVSVKGGTTAWVAQGLSSKQGRGVISIERQVRIAAGAIVLISVLLGFALCKLFFVIPGLVVSGLIFAGITDFCGMGILLSKMPWNQR